MSEFVWSCSLVIFCDGQLSGFHKRKQSLKLILFQPSKLINVITKELSFLFPTPETPFEFGESEELNQFAQALAEQNGNPMLQKACKRYAIVIF